VLFSNPKSLDIIVISNLKQSTLSTSSALIIKNDISSSNAVSSANFSNVTQE